MAAIFFMIPAGIFYVIAWVLPQVDLIAKWSHFTFIEKLTFDVVGFLMGVVIIICFWKQKKAVAIGFLFYIVLDIVNVLTFNNIEGPTMTCSGSHKKTCAR